MKKKFIEVYNQVVSFLKIFINVMLVAIWMFILICTFGIVDLSFGRWEL